MRSGRCATRPVRSRGAADVQVRGVVIEDTFAEAFGMRGARLIITALARRRGRLVHAQHERDRGDQERHPYGGRGHASLVS